MSLHRVGCVVGDPRFPRVSGDEPGMLGGAAPVVGFSPRERG